MECRGAAPAGARGVLAKPFFLLCCAARGRHNTKTNKVGIRHVPVPPRGTRSVGARCLAYAPTPHTLSYRFSWPLLRLWSQSRTHLNLVQGLLDGTLELWINIMHVILGSDINLDIGVGAVVFHVPPHVLKPERGLRLGRYRAINQLVMGIDADDAAPCTLADQWPQ